MRYDYNAFNLPTKITDALGGETTFTYDGNGQVLTITDARGKTTTWTYNSMGLVATRTDPLSRQESFVYDLNGNLIEWTDRKGQVTAYEYDALDRQTFVGFHRTGTPATYDNTITMTYDAADRATQIADSSAGTIARIYDLFNRLTQEDTPEGTVDYTYDAAGRRATMQVQGETQVSYTYDNADRLTAVTKGTSVTGIAYDSAGRRTSLTLPNGVVVEYGYDDNSQVTGLTYKLGSTTLGTLTYEYDANGQRTTVGGTWARSNLPSALASTTYDDANQISSRGSATFTYDANGNLTSTGSDTFTWNARNELTAVSSLSATFAYDALGRRRTRTVGTDARQYLYDRFNPVQELVSGTASANLVTGLSVDEYFTRSDSSGTANYLADAIGSTVALTDSSGSTQTQYTYEPFGAATTSGTATASTLAFTGRERDGAALFYYRGRYYDPSLHRFISEDPINFASGESNLHAYVANDPVNRVDPSGEVWVAPVVGGIVGGGVDLASQLWRNGGNFGCVSWGSVGASALSGALFGSLGPSGAFFGRGRLGAPKWFGNLNTKPNIRIGWFWNGTGKQGRNVFGRHGGTPYTPSHWHDPYYIPGPATAAEIPFGTAGGALGAGIFGGSGNCGSTPPPPPEGDSPTAGRGK